MAPAVRPERPAEQLPSDPFGLFRELERTAPPAAAPASDDPMGLFGATAAAPDPMGLFAPPAASPAPAATRTYTPRIEPPAPIDLEAVAPVVPEPPEDPAVVAHRAKFGQTPAQVARDPSDGATVTTGKPVGIGVPKDELDRIFGDSPLKTRIAARLAALYSPEGYTYTPDPPTFADLATDVFMQQMASPFIGEVSDVATQRRMDEYVAGGGQFEPWRANVLGLIASGGAVTGNVATGKAMPYGGYGRTGAQSAAARLGIPGATEAMRAGAAKAIEDIALEHRIHPSLAAKMADHAKRALAARGPLATEAAGAAGVQGVAGTAMGAMGAVAAGERDPLAIARAAGESGLEFAALGAAFHGLSAEAQFRRGYEATRASLARAEQLRERLAAEQLRTTPAAESPTRAVTTVEPAAEPVQTSGPAAPAAPASGSVLPKQNRPVDGLPPELVDDPYLTKLNQRTDVSPYEREILRKQYVDMHEGLKALRGAEAPAAASGAPAPTEPPPAAAPVAASAPSEPTVTLAESQAAAPRAADGGPRVSPDDIPYAAALDAYRWISMTPERRARRTQEEYVEHIRAVYDEFKGLATTPEQQQQLADEIERYRQGYVTRELAVLAARSRTASPMVTGPAGFNNRRNEKANNAERRRVEEFLEWSKRAQAAIRKKIAPEESDVISSDDPNAIEALRKKVEVARDMQEKMKAANNLIRHVGLKGTTPEQFKAAINRIRPKLQEIGLSDEQIEKAANRGGFQHFTLQNNLANIKRMEQRIVELERRRADVTAETPFADGRVLDNVEDNRIQLFFAGKPAPEMVAKLKRNGFKWAPSVGAWQRQRTRNARDATEALLGIKLVAPRPSAVQTSATDAPRPDASGAGAPPVERPGGSGAGGAPVDAAGGARPAAVRPGEGATPDAPGAEPEPAAAAVVPPSSKGVRDEQGRLRRNLRDVSSEAIADELVALGNAIGEDANVGTTKRDDSNHWSTMPGASKLFGTEGSMKAAGRNKARGQAMQRLTAELERRGEDPEAALEAALERAAEAEGKAADERPRRRGEDPGEEEVAPGVRFAPAHEGEDLFGESRESASDQRSMFSGKEGTAAARNLKQTEAASRAELERLRLEVRESDRQIARLQGFGHAAERQKLMQKAATAKSRIEQLEKLLNRDEKITADELATRAGAESGKEHREQLGDDDIGPAQGALFSPAGAAGRLGDRFRQAIGLSPRAAARAKEAVKSLREISQSLADMAGVPLREGRFNAKKHQALGAFFPKSEVARTIRMDKLDTAAHEVGHYVSKKYLRNPTKKGAKDRAAPKLTFTMKRELVKMGRDLYGPRKPTGGYGEEGIAQWARFYVVNPEQLAADAPEFSKWMNEHVLPKEPGLKAAMDQARADFKAYRESPDDAKIDAMINTKPGFRMMPDPRKLATWYLDDLAEIRRAVDELAALGSDAPAHKQAYILARLTRGNAGAAEEMIDRGIVDPTTGKRVTRGIREILGELKPEDIQPLRRYLVAERALEFWERGINPGIPQGVAKRRADHYRAKYGKVGEELWGVSNALLDYRVAKGNLTKSEADHIKKNNRRRVGFYRVFEEDERAAPRSGLGRGFGRNSSGLQKATGSSREIIDPLESLLTDIHKTVKQSHSSEVLAALVKHANRTEGGGRVVEILTETPQEAVKIPLWQIREQLRELGYEHASDTEPGEMTNREPPEAILHAFRDRITAGSRETKDLVRPVVIDGTRHWIQINDAQLYDALSGLGTPELPMWLRWLSIPTRTLRAGATLTAEFTARNPVRDAVTAAIYSRAGFRPPGVDLVRGLLHVLGKTEGYEQWRLSGGDNAAMLGLDRATVRKRILEVLRDNAVFDRRVYTTARDDLQREGGKLPRTRAALNARGWVLRPIDALRMLSSLTENATRVGEYTAVKKKAEARGASEQEAKAEATIASRDVTIDFAQAGTQTRIANQLIEFLNANVRGWAKFAREHKERPETVIPRALALITIPSLVLWYLQKDDEAYQDVPTWQKALAWVIVDRGPDGELKHIWRIPKPPDLGIVYGTLFERIAEHVYREDPKAFAKTAESFKSLVPIDLGFFTVTRPLIEWWANKSMFTGRKIVPQGVEDLPPGEQSSSRTGEFARLLGERTNLSPAKLENAVRGYTAGLGTYFLEALNAGTREARAIMDLKPLPTPAQRETDTIEDLPGLKGFLVKKPALDAQSVQDVLDLFNAGEAHRQAWRKRLESGDVAGARTYFQEHEDEIRRVAHVTDRMGDQRLGIGPLRRAFDLITDAQQLATGADDATREQLADKAINAARAGLAGDAVSREDRRALRRQRAQRDAIKTRARRDAAKAPPNNN